MDTPAPAKCPRRKLKRVLKRKVLSSSFSHNSSNHSLYQKKLKNAINASLNLTSNVRTLQTNNRSLALQVAKLRGELRRVFNEHMRLLEDNHSRNERILELERQLDLTPSIIEHEVNSRCQAKVQTMQSHIDLLQEKAFAFTQGLMELRECCTVSPRKSGNSLSSQSFRRSTRSSRSGDTPISVHNSPVDSGSRTEHNLHERFLKRPDLEMSMLLEASHLADPLAASASPFQKDDVLEEEEKSADHEPSQFSSLPPQRQLVSSLETEDFNIIYQDHLIYDKDAPLSTTALRRCGRRNSQLIGKARSPLQNDQEIFDKLENTASPELVSPGNEQHVKLNEATFVRNSPSEFPNLKSLQKSPSKVTKKKIKDHKTKKSSEVTTPPISSRKSIEQIAGVETRPVSERLRASCSSPESPCKEKTTHIEVDMELTRGVLDEFSIQRAQSPKLSSKENILLNENVSIENLSGDNGTVTVNKSSLCPDLSREDLPLTKLPLPSTRSRERHASSSSAEDKPEAPSVPDAISMKVSRGGKLVFAVSRKGADGSRATVQPFIKARSKSKKAQKVEATQTSSNRDEQDVENIFDFHDKTPKSLQHNPCQASMSVFSLSADESALSPLGALNHLREAKKNVERDKHSIEIPKESAQVNVENKIDSSPASSRSRSRSRNVVSRNRSRNNQSEEQVEDNSQSVMVKDKDLISQETKHISEINSSAPLSSIPVNNIASTFVGEVYMAPLKGSPGAKPRYRTRSQSRGRKSSRDQQSPGSGRKVRPNSAVRPGRSRRRVRDSESPEVLGNSDGKTDPPSQTSIADPEEQTGLEEMDKDGGCAEEGRKGNKSSVAGIETKSTLANNRIKNSRLTITLSPTKRNCNRESNEKVTDLPYQSSRHENEKVSSMNIEVESNAQENDCENAEIPSNSAESKLPVKKKEKSMKSGSPCCKSRKEASERFKSEKQEISKSRLLKSKHSSPTSNKQKYQFENQEAEISLKSNGQVSRDLVVSSSPDLALERDAVADEGDSSGSNVKDCQVISRGYSKQASTTDFRDTQKTLNSLAISDKQKLSCFTGKTTCSLDQQDVVEIVGQPEVKDLKLKEESPERSRSKQKVAKTSKSTSKKKAKVEKKIQGLGNSTQESEAQEAMELCEVQQKENPKPKVKGESQALPSSSTSEEEPTVSKTIKNNSNLFSSESPKWEGRKRRAASNVSYVAPPLNSKMRRGDPFTSHYASEKISIYKSPKSKAKEREKAKLRKDIFMVLHKLHIKEDPEGADVGQD